MITLFSRLKDEDVGADEYLAHAEIVAGRRHRRCGAAGGRRAGGAGADLCPVPDAHGSPRARSTSATRSWRCSVSCARAPTCSGAASSATAFILVDEFQDTNYAQFEVVKLLAARHRNVTVVGDDDQAIFRFRGASMSNILDFDRTYPDAKKVVLLENRRSPQAVLDAAYRLIQFNNPDRLEVAQGIDKELKSTGPDGRPRVGVGPQHLAFDTVSSESDQVAELIAEEHEAGRPYRDCAILVRANHDADAFLRALNLRSIPWTFSGNAGLYGRPEIRLAHRVPPKRGAS